IRGRLGNGGERAAFDQLLTRLESFVPIREARARWQLVTSGAMRRAVQRRGRMLVDQGGIDTGDDVFFLTPGEHHPPARDGREAIATRRAEQARWARVSPPPVIGNTVAPAPNPDGEVLRGAPGSPGVARGTARVIVDLADAERLGDGDILVTTM